MLCLLQSPSRRRSGAAQIDRVRATTRSLSIRQSLAMVLPRYPIVVSILSAVTFSRINNLSRAMLPTYQPPHVRYRQRYWVNFTCWYYFVKWDAAIQYWLSDTRDQVWSRFTHRFEWHPNAENNQHQYVTLLTSILIYVWIFISRDSISLILFYVNCRNNSNDQFRRCNFKIPLMMLKFIGLHNPFQSPFRTQNIRHANNKTRWLDMDESMEIDKAILAASASN